MRALCCLILLCVSATAMAADEVYRWVDENKVVHYGNQPPTKDAKPAKLPPIQVMSGNGATDIEGTDSTQRVVKLQAPGFPIAITQPQPDQTIRGGERQVKIMVSLPQGLPEGAGLVYYLDGNARNSRPVQSLSFAINEVDRGSHMVEVAAVDGRGKELGRAAPVIVHVKPPGVN